MTKNGWRVAAAGTLAAVVVAGGAGTAAAYDRDLSPYGGPNGPDTVWGIVGCQVGWFFPVAAESVTVTDWNGRMWELVPDPVFGTFNFDTTVVDGEAGPLHLEAVCEIPGFEPYTVEYDTATVTKDNNLLHYVGSYYSYPPEG